MAVLLVVLACWLFNVRVPWQWEWLKWAWYGLEWTFYGLLISLSLSRLVVLCGRAIGRFQPSPAIHRKA